MAPQNSRTSVRVLLGLIALIITAYLIEIYFMGAPTFGRSSDQRYMHEVEPFAFWTHFTLFAFLGAASAYFCADWKKALSVIGSVETKDELMLGKVSVERARKIRENCLLGVGLTGGLLAGLLFLLGMLLFA